MKQVEILSYSGVSGEYGYYTVYGEVKNNLNYNVKYVKIVASYYNNANQFLGSAFTYTELDTIKPGQKSPFEISTYPDKYTPSKVTLQVSFSRDYSNPLAGVSILNHSGRTDSYGYYDVIGEVKNNSNSDARYVKLVCTYYDDNGKVIGCSFSYAEMDTLRPGQSSPYEVTSYPLKIRPASYSIQVQATE